MSDNLDCPHTRQYIKDKKRYCEDCGVKIKIEAEGEKP